MSQFYSYFQAKATGISPLCRLMCGNGPYEGMADQVSAWQKANRKPLVIFRGSPERPLKQADNGRVWTVEELAADYRAFFGELKRRRVDIALLADDGEYDPADVTDAAYHGALIGPALDSYPDLKWANYDLMPRDSLLGDSQTALTPVFSLFNRWWEPAETWPKTWAERLADAREQRAKCLATGKPVIPWLPAWSNADPSVTREQWNEHAAEVLADHETVLLFDEDRPEGRDGHRNGREGRDQRNDVVKIAKTLKAAAA